MTAVARPFSVLGYPLLTEAEDARADAHCLLQLASTKKHKLTCGDAQTLRFTLRAGALAKGSFARVEVTADEV